MYTSVEEPVKCHFQKGLKNAIENRRLLNCDSSLIFKDIHLLFFFILKPIKCSLWKLKQI